MKYLKLTLWLFWAMLALDLVGCFITASHGWLLRSLLDVVRDCALIYILRQIIANEAERE